MDTGIIILAAGNSSRLGSPKQLLDFQGKTLLCRVIDTALDSPFRPIVTVLGASSHKIQIAHRSQEIHWVTNLEWELGMSSSIGAGVAGLLSIDNDLQHIIIAVCDQVHLTSGLLSSLKKKYEQSGKGIIASAYKGTLGTPVMFHSKYFKRLQALSGSCGAKTLIKLYPEDVESLEFKRGDIDIDTNLDYQNLLREPEKIDSN